MVFWNVRKFPVCQVYINSQLLKLPKSFTPYILVNKLHKKNKQTDDEMENDWKNVKCLKLIN